MFKYSRTLLNAVLVLAIYACTPSQQSLFADGKAAFEAYDYRTARVTLSQALKQEPDNPEMQLLLVRTYLKLGNGDRASEWLEKLSPELRTQERVHLLQGEAALLSGRLNDALNILKYIKNPEADRLRSLVYIAKGDIDTAIENFETGLAREQPSALLLATYARFEFERAQWNRSDELAKQALQLNPKLIEGLLVRAELYERRNQLPESLLAFDNVLGLNSSNFDAQLGKARVLAAMGKGDDALAIAQALQEEDSESVAVATVRARVSAEKGDWSAVRGILQPFETDLRAHFDGAMIYAEALIELGLPSQALGYLAPHIEEQPGQRKLRALYARALYESGESKKALALIRLLADRPDASPTELRLAARIAKAANDPAGAGFEERIDQPSPEWVGGQIAQADMALRNRQWAKAEQAYIGIINKLGAGNAMVLNNLAYTQGKLGKSEQALKWGLAAAKIDPSNPSILDTAGVLLIENGQHERGIAMLREAEQLAPNNVTIKQHLTTAGAT